MADVIPALFEREIHDAIYTRIKYQGVKRTEKEMVGLGYHPSFIRASIRRIMRHRGW